MEEAIIDYLLASNNMGQVELFWRHHIDLFIKHQTAFGKYINSPNFNLREYTLFSNTWMKTKKFVDSLITHYEVEEEAVGQNQLTKQLRKISPSKSKASASKSSKYTLSPQSDDISSSSPSPKESFATRINRGMSEQISLRELEQLSLSSPILRHGRERKIFWKKNGPSSIFKIVDVPHMANGLHKLYVSLYFLTELRYVQYSLTHSDVKGSYLYALKGLFQNFLRIMEREMDVQCQKGKFPKLVGNFLNFMEELISHGNIPLAKAFISYIERIQSCDDKVKEALNKFKAQIDGYKETGYVYFTNPEKMKTDFIAWADRSAEKSKKLGGMKIIYEKVYATRREMINEEDLFYVERAEDDDFKIFMILQPTQIIEKTLGAKKNDEGELDCIKSKCPQI
jgi:hypothetical protein